jgi:hypothetical protein
MSIQDQSGKTPEHRYSASRGQLAAIWSQAGFQHHRRQFWTRSASLKIDPVDPQRAMFADYSREDRRTIEDRLRWGACLTACSKYVLAGTRSGTALHVK